MPVSWYLFFLGLLSLLGQVVLLRELNVALYGVELVYVLAIGVWLLGTALGALMGRRNFVPSTAIVRNTLFFAACLILPDIAFIRGSRWLLSGIPGGYLPFVAQISILGIALLPLSGLAGLLFQWSARAYISGKRTLARAYAIESAGGLIGGIASTLLIVVHVGNLTLGILCVLSIALLLILDSWKLQNSIVRLSGILVTGILVILLADAPYLDRTMTAWNHPFLKESRDTPYGRITVSSYSEQVSIFENDALVFETESTAAEKLVHLALLQQPHPQSVLILGGGLSGLVREVSKYKPGRIRYVEINRDLVALATQYLPKAVLAPLCDPTVEILYRDPRAYLQESSGSDVILVGAPEPTSGQSNRFYTREFYSQCARILRPGGVLAFCISSSENLWVPQLVRRNLSIFRAVEASFQEIIVLPGSQNVVIAANHPMDKDSEILANRWRAGGIESRLISSQYIRYLFSNDRYHEINSLVQTAGVPINTDLRPVCYQASLMLWLAKFFPAMGKVSIPMRGMSMWFLLLPAAVILSLFWLAHYQRKFAVILLVGIAGFTGMVGEALLLLHYQIMNGVLYRDIGILLTGYMAGLTLGAWAISEFYRSGSTIPRFRQSTGWLLPGGLVLVYGGYLVWSNSPVVGGLPITVFLMMTTGFLVGGIFAFASLQGRKDGRTLVSPLYAADLAGGCFGAVLATLVLIPMVGMNGTAIGLILLACLAMFLI